jgi:murein DD-endopeptidase MepM/ murein hydrolase activator NlpD
MSLLTISSICLSILIYSKHDEDRVSLLCSKIGLDIDFSKVNSNISSYFDSLVGLDFLKKSFYSSEQVSSESVYLSLGDDYYTNDDYSIHAMCGGVVVYVVEDDNLYDVTVAYDNEISVVYYSLDEIFVSLMDRVEAEDVIAKYSDKFKMVLLKNGKKVSYEEIYS